MQNMEQMSYFLLQMLKGIIDVKKYTITLYFFCYKNVALKWSFNRKMMIYLLVISLSWLQFSTVPIHILPYSIRDVSCMCE